MLTSSTALTHDSTLPKKFFEAGKYVLRFFISSKGACSVNFTKRWAVSLSFTSTFVITCSTELAFSVTVPSEDTSIKSAITGSLRSLRPNGGRQASSPFV
jgi:hypothetical protein